MLPDLVLPRREAERRSLAVTRMAIHRIRTGPLLLACALWATMSCGCEQPLVEALHPANVMHELQPHRLWRQNRNRPLSENAYFSVPAPTDPTASADQLGSTVTE